MSDRRFGSLLSLLRQGFSVEREFGTHSLAALLSMAELVEQSVYARGSLIWTPSALAFRLNNPPLRTGAFSSLGVSVDRVAIPPERVRFRIGPGFSWRSASNLAADRPLELRPGLPTEVELGTTEPTDPKNVTVRLELRSVAIPPLVWFEFTDALRREDGA